MRKFIKHVLTVSLAFVGLSNNTFSDSSYYEAYPPFLVSGVKPNVLIILDNSNSMDEDFYGEAVGSYSPSSKSVVAKKALRDLISELKDKLRVGLMTYKLSNVYRHHIHNSLYFASYEPKSYCPSHNKVCSNNVSQLCESDDDCSGGSCVDPCVKYCQTGSLTYKNICDEQCKAGNDLFDVDYFDEIIENYSIGSEQRSRYCRLVYPKTQRITNPTDSSHYIYYKHAYPFYSGSDHGTRFAYSKTYDPDEGRPWDTYWVYIRKIGTSDSFDGYSSYAGRAQFYPTDTDIALGYLDFGRRQMWYHVGRTWFSNVSPGKGYLHVQVNDLVDDSGSETNTYQDLWSKLDPKENNESGYMSCSISNKNKCSYIINAGLTPTAGTFKSAIDYFKGNSSPIQYRCQKTYVVYVTDGLPSVDENGNEKSADELMPKVLQRIDQLRSLVKTINGIDYTFDIKTYVLGVGLSDEAKAKLDEMAIHGGTDINGHAYYADNPQELIDALNKIFLNILKRASSGTSVAVISGKAKKGNVINQAIFYPRKSIQTRTIEWPGYVYYWWFYNSKDVQNIREDTNSNYILDLLADYILEWNIDEVENLEINAYESDEQGKKKDLVDTYDSFDEAHPIVEVGDKLKNLRASEREIYTNLLGDLIEFKPSNASRFIVQTSYENNIFRIPLLGLPADCFDLCQYFSDDCYTPWCLYNRMIDCLNNHNDYDKLINWVRGMDYPDFRIRKVDSGPIPSSGTDEDVWKLGDIIYSDPVPVDYGNYTVLYVGSNDGMLHAFKAGYVKKGSSNPSQHQQAFIQNSKNDSGTDQLGEEMWAFIPENVLPYLRYLADPDYHHMYFVDLKPYVVEKGSSLKVLIGGMRLGGATGSDSENAIHPPNYACPASFWQEMKKFCEDCMGLIGGSFICNLIPTPDADYSNCIGLSSYFALDVTDPENPELLWEFSHPDLGFSYSGPGIIKTKDGKYHVVFASGPINYSAQYTNNDQDTLKIFILDLRTGNLEREIDTGVRKAFSGRIFSDGVDMNGDNFTDYLVFGYTRQDGVDTNYKGGLIVLAGDVSGNKLYPLTNDVSEWKVKNITALGTDIPPVTSKVEFMKCFDKWYMYFGSGRWFKKNDDWEVNRNILFGIPVKPDTADGDIYHYENFHYVEFLTGTQDVTDESHAQNICTDASHHVIRGWYLRLDGANGDYLKEKATSDPTITDSNVVFFTTIQPTADVCGFGGRSRMWQLNCALGASITYSCPEYRVSPPQGTLLLQLSGGDIQQLTPSSSFTEGRTTQWYVGIAPESATPFITPGGGSLVGQLLLWIER